MNREVAIIARLVTLLSKMRAFTTVALLAFASETIAWGGLGHRTVGYLAQKYFNENAVAYFEKVINPSNAFDISDAAVWADSVRYRRPYTSGWHFIVRRLS